MGKQSKRKKNKAVWKNFRLGKEMVAVIPDIGSALAIQYPIPPDPKVPEILVDILEFACSVREIAKNKQIGEGKGIFAVSDADYRRKILGIEDNPFNLPVVYDWLTVSDLKKLIKPNMDTGWEQALAQLISISVKNTDCDFGFPFWWRGAPLLLENEESGKSSETELMDVIMVVQHDLEFFSGLNIQLIP